MAEMEQLISLSLMVLYRLIREHPSTLDYILVMHVRSLHLTDDGYRNRIKILIDSGNALALVASNV